MKTALLYGLLIAIASAVMTLVLYFTGLHDSVDRMQTAQWIGGLGGLGILVTGLVLAMRDRRAARAGDPDWGYGSAFGAGVLTAFFAALFGAVSAYLYFGFINPSASEVILEMQMEKMTEAGAPPEQIDRMQPMLRKWMSPGLLAVTQTFSAILMGIVLSLILAIFHRRPLPAAPAEAPPTLA